MKKNTVQIGASYLGKVSGSLTILTVKRCVTYGKRGAFSPLRTMFECENIRTGRLIECSASRFKRRVSQLEVDYFLAANGRVFDVPGVAYYKPDEAYTRKKKRCQNEKGGGFDGD